MWYAVSLICRINGTFDQTSTKIKHYDLKNLKSLNQGAYVKFPNMVRSFQTTLFFFLN
jgi:transcriptional regulator NrdR family protein